MKSLSRVQLCDPMDCSLPGSSAHRIFQARVLEWGAIAFPQWSTSEVVVVKSLSHVQLLATPWTAACQAPPSMGFSRQEYWNGVPVMAIVNQLIILVHISQQTVFLKAISKNEISLMNTSGGRLIYNLKS